MRSRREFIGGAAAAASVAWLHPRGVAQRPGPGEGSLTEFGYDQVRISGDRQVAQRDNVTAILKGLHDDSLLMPFRAMADQPAPGVSLGGWYEWNPSYDFHHDDAGLAPGATFGQWTSAMARLSAASKFGGAAGDAQMAEQAMRLHALLAQAIATGYFRRTRFPGYSFEKLVCGLMDAHRLLGDATAFATLDKVTAAVKTVLPGYAVNRETQWKMGADQSWMWDETYTIPENLFLVASLGAGAPYRAMAQAYLLNETYFEPLSRGVNVLSDRHAYSYVNALCSAMQAYFVEGSAMHLQAARNGFAMLQLQSFATGGWGPDELLRKPGFEQVDKSLTASHNSFETPCGSYAHMKLTRYLLRATRDGMYGDSMERVMHNTVLGVLPLEPDGRSFYYSDYNVAGKRVYSLHRWPCCSGTLPQVVADYGINSYLREPGAVWINLYQPSELRWNEGGVAMRLEQTGSYLEDGKVRCSITAARPAKQALRFRVPAWVGEGTTLRVNGRTQPMVVSKGFATVERVWRGGDVVDLQFPMALRLEALPANGGTPHPETVALLWGPLVLFALREAGDAGPLPFTSDALLSAARTGPLEWSAKSSTGMRRLVPFVAVGENEYSTYVKLV